MLEFLNCEKYPPSLLFLLMTLGPMLAVYPLLNYIRGTAAEILLTFGRVSLFFYLLTIPFIHALAVLQAVVNGQSLTWLFGGFPLLQKPADQGIPLPIVYVVWPLILLTLFPLCSRYGSEKLLRRRWWHSLL
jgi:uncharacterized membrane protein